MSVFAKGWPTWPDWFSPPTAGVGFVPQGLPPKMASDGFPGMVNGSALHASTSAAALEARARRVKA